MTTNIPPNNSSNFANLKCDPSTLICREKTTILGDVTIGANCVIHPTATIHARNGPIEIGDTNLIEERVTIVNNRTEPMTIGDHNTFEVDCYSEAIRMGNHNVLESKSSLGQNIELTNNCIIGAGCRIQDVSNQIDRLPPNTVISGSKLDRKTVTEMPSSTLTTQLDFLRKFLPNYQKIWRPGVSSVVTKQEK